MKKSFILIFILLIIGCFEVEAASDHLTCDYCIPVDGSDSCVNSGDGVKIIVNDIGSTFESTLTMYKWDVLLRQNNNVEKQNFLVHNFLKGNGCSKELFYFCTDLRTCSVHENSQDYHNYQGNAGAIQFSGKLLLKNEYQSDFSGNQQGQNSSKPLDFDFNGILGTEKCPAIFGHVDQEGSIMYMLKNYFFTPVRILTPIILILLTTLDFAKAVFADEKDGMKKAQGNFMKRAVAALIIFLAPTIVSTLLSLADYIQTNDCAKDTNNDVFENL